MAKELDLDGLNSKLDFQNQDYWLHLDASTNLDKYPGDYAILPPRNGRRI